ncbi:hypothetical protein [Sedimentitalea nanhaiensis]|uniref:3-methyladenine DNA glycosylase AlkC n=1 Tax=Sedimentitalea nanhaiensis TaxID=999627 RepID=A0A1I7D022_9RHOB|nr:hypothetical protein [Sedimentitalea nanhaiensis]SFU05029.1 3-methyladenine DNA glycosylase AlkC [Sedimentitalea nanhaiensis]
MATGFSLKDQLFNSEKVGYLADLFAAADGGFAANRFQTQVMERLPELELKQRISWIAECLGAQIPGPLHDLAPVLLAALPPPLDPSRTDDDFGDFIFAPLGELVATRGLETPDLALNLLAEITQRFSMEWAIRPFLNRWPDLVLERMADWVDHDSYHVRRLVSEGTRPRLPWGQGIALEITAPLPLLDRLHGDTTRYVTRSVANHMNDISKRVPELAMDRLDGWAEQGRQERAELDWMTRHALRGLIKAGDPRAMVMLGYDPDAGIDVDEFRLPRKIAIGEVLTVSARLRATQDCGALVDYILWRRKANGGLTAKVFKLKQVQLRVGQTVELTKSHRLRGDATTFRLYPGAHKVELQVNGRVRAEAWFDLGADQTRNTRN